ncbi:MAG TPA: hypothetical protein VFZ37_09965 [Jiangellaceae bacterium]
MSAVNAGNTAKTASPAPAGNRPRLRVVQAVATAPRAPFVALVLTILGVGLIGLLLISSSLQQGSFELRDLEQRAQELRATETALLHDIAQQAAPDELALRAEQLGMVPAEDRRFLEVSREVSP